MGLSVLDAGVVIGLLDRNDAHHAAATAAVRRLHDADDQMCLPASALAEVLVGPHRRGADDVQRVHDFVERVPVDVVLLDVDIANAAAQLRAAIPSLKLPDALVVATAQSIGASELVTTDRGWSLDRIDLDITVI